MKTLKVKYPHLSPAGENTIIEVTREFSGDHIWQLDPLGCLHIAQPTRLTNAQGQQQLNELALYAPHQWISCEYVGEADQISIPASMLPSGGLSVTPGGAGQSATQYGGDGQIGNELALVSGLASPVNA